MVLACAFIALSLGGIARAQSPEPSSFFEIDPMVALNGFAVLAGARSCCCSRSIANARKNFAATVFA
jgi:hypothetical protein